MFHTAYTFGRFNIPHRGHLHLFRSLQDFSSNVTVGVSTGKGNLPIEERISALKAMCPEINFIPAKNAFDLPIEEEDVFILGQDAEPLVNAIGKHRQCATFLLRRGENQPSSTACRKAFQENDVERLVELLPSEHIETASKLWEMELQSA